MRIIWKEIDTNKFAHETNQGNKYDYINWYFLTKKMFLRKMRGVIHYELVIYSLSIYYADTNRKYFRVQLRLDKAL